MTNGPRVALDVERLTSFSDAVFAIAITLMVIDLRLPERVTESELASALGDLVPQYASFLLSFVVIGAFWIAHHRMFRFIVGWNQTLLVLNLLLLLTIAFLPFPTSLIGRFQGTTPAAIVYSGAVLACSLASALLWWYSISREGLLDPQTPRPTIRAIRSGGLAVVAVFGIALVIAPFAPGVASSIWWLAFPARWLGARFGGRA
jgi:uncharacterized membrane protein